MKGKLKNEPSCDAWGNIGLTSSDWVIKNNNMASYEFLSYLSRTEEEQKFLSGFELTTVATKVAAITQ